MATDRGGQDTAGLASLRASDADREQIVYLLKAAFLEGLLTRDELGERVGGALTARTHADLAMVTVGIPPGVAAASPRAPAPTPAPAPAPVRTRRRPGRRAKTGACLIVTTVMMVIDAALTGNGAGPMANGFYVLFIMAFVVSFLAWLCAIAADRGASPAGQPPQRPVPGGHGEATDRAVPCDPSGAKPLPAPPGQLPVQRQQRETAACYRSAAYVMPYPARPRAPACARSFASVAIRAARWKLPN